jgi:hypothetical protein
MPTVVQFRRGTTAQNNSFTGAAGELSVDTTLGTIRVHNGIAGGNTLASIDAVQTLSNKTLATPTITGTLSSNGLINTSGNIICASISAGTYVGLSSSKINTNASNVTVDSSYVNVAVNGTNVAAFSSQSLSLTGFLNTTGNIICSVLDAGSIECTGIVYANSTAQSTSTTTGALEVAGGVGIVGNLNVGDGTLSGGTHRFQGNIVPFSSNTYTLGTNTAWWTITYSRAVQAQYADLAEIYTSDQQYPAGTVLIFDGEAEVTQSHSSHDTRIAGVVSTNPAYLMNGAESGIPVALQGRVPCRVLGPVSKGDRVVASHVAGVAQALDPQQYQPGCIIGKALQAIDSTDISTIEVVVGRL